MGGLVLRRATLADLDAVAAIHEAAARAGYRDVFPPTVPFPREQACRELASHLADNATSVMLALDGNETAGFVAYARCDDPELAEHGEIRLLHVHPDRWGSGIGTRLHASALEGFAHAGHRRAMLWVLVGNRRARRFYERRGWAADGAIRTEHHVIDVEIMRYARDL